MWPIEWHHCQCPWMTLKVTFVVWNLSSSHISWNIARIYKYIASRGPSVYRPVSALFECLSVEAIWHVVAVWRWLELPTPCDCTFGFSRDGSLTLNTGSSTVRRSSLWTPRPAARVWPYRTERLHVGPTTTEVAIDCSSSISCAVTNRRTCSFLCWILLILPTSDDWLKPITIGYDPRR